MTQLPARTGVSDTYPNPDNATMRSSMGTIHDVLKEAFETAMISLAAAATTNIGGQLSTKLLITGTGGPVTSLGSTYRGPIELQIDTGPVTFTYNLTTLRTPGSVDLVAYAGDILLAFPKGDPLDGWHITRLHRATAKRVSIASHATTAAIWEDAAQDVDWTGTETTTALPDAPLIGARRKLHIAAACSFTADANLLIDGLAAAETVTLAANDIVDVFAIALDTFRLVITKYDGSPVRGYATDAEAAAGTVTNKPIVPSVLASLYGAGSQTNEITPLKISGSLDNQKIVKRGSVSNTSSGTVNFDDDFPTACQNVILTCQDGAFRHAFLTAAPLVGSFTYEVDSSGGSTAATDVLYWQAEGY